MNPVIPGYFRPADELSSTGFRAVVEIDIMGIRE